jgi:sugar phosphate isomerase/epimerase
LRKEHDLYLSWHLPNLSWKSEAICGIENVRSQLNCALDMGVNHLTIHVPGAPAVAMKNKSLYQRFEDVYKDLFEHAVKSGIRLAIENVHNTSGVCPDDADCKFGTDIDAYVNWLNALANRFDHKPNVGAHFDVGHARNNGELGNMQPLSEWYARIGTRILGYHIHQIGTNAETGKIANHTEMHTPFDKRISYAGFFYAWSTQQINRAPLFVEIRDHDQRQRTTQRLQKLFNRAKEIHTSLDLPGRTTI